MSHQFKSYKAKEDMIAAAVEFMSAHIEATLSQNRHAGLLLSGGSSPRPIYQALSEKNIAWERVNIGLVDERWVEPGQAGSNRDFIHDSLLRNKAKSANFIAMKSAHETAALGAAEINSRYQAAFNPADLCVMGMGLDGHTASWFPGAQDLHVALDINNQDIVCAQNAAGCPVAGLHPERITLTLPAVMAARHIILLIAGDEKKAVFDAAVNKSVKEAPVKALLNAGTKLTVFWGAS